MAYKNKGVTRRLKKNRRGVKTMRRGRGTNEVKVKRKKDKLFHSDDKIHDDEVLFMGGYGRYRESMFDMMMRMDLGTMK
jgi:hypothetical protein